MDNTKTKWKTNADKQLNEIKDVAFTNCTATNPQNPLAVAHSIYELHEALKALVDHFRMNDENYYKSELCTNAINALREAEGKL